MNFVCINANEIINTEMDWSLCTVCQQATSEPLRCPLNTKDVHKSAPAAYASFLENVARFRELNCLPIPLVFDRDTEVNDFVRNRAQWHKSCHAQFNTNRLERARKRERDDTPDSSATEDRRRLPRQSVDKTKCIFCTKQDRLLHEFSTLGTDHNVRSMARDLQDTELLTKIEGIGDLIALEAKYHLPCLVGLRNRHRSLVRQNEAFQDQTVEERQFRARAFAELFTHIENAVEDGTFFFKFATLRQLYESRLADFGIKCEINKVRFREQVLKHFPHAQEQNDGKNMVLVFEQGMQQMLKQGVKNDYEGDMLVLAKAAKIVRDDIFRCSGFEFDASFPSDCQQKSVPNNLKSLVTMLMRGADLQDQQPRDSQACLTVSQIILFNCKKAVGNKKPSTAAKSRHSLEHEPPLPLYLGLNIHTQTRSKKLVMQLYKLGLSISYDRVLQIESNLTTGICENMTAKGVVCPVQLREGIFTVGALDNIDHNPSSTTSKASFHGTGISLFQFPTKSNEGKAQYGIRLPSPDVKKNYQLPDSYTTVPAVAFQKTAVAVPKPPHDIKTVSGHMEKAMIKEKQWLQHARQLMEQEEVVKGDTMAWSAYHASLQGNSGDVQRVITQLLPLFNENAATAAMIKHGMSVLCTSIQFLNPGQIPVVALDAPLYALAKLVQWRWPHTHGEDKYVAMFGGLHIEMAVSKTVGDYLEASGWTTALTQASIASSGTADSFLKASHLTKTRHAHEVSAVALSKLQHDAFLKMVTEGPTDDATQEAWRQKMVKKSPTFQYWNTILNIELLGLVFVRAHRQRDFHLYIESLKALVPWFFAFDHQNYARWIPVHIRDMESLPPAIRHEFEDNGTWVVPKTTRRFSAIPIDQAHEQNNKLVKGAGGAVGLTENPSALKKWMVAGPEQARLLTEFEEQFIDISEDEDQCHHEEGLSAQKTCHEQALNLVSVITEMSNPFLDDGPELLTLDTRNVMQDSVVNTVRTVEALGSKQYDNYRESVITNLTKSVHEPINKNSLPLFRSPPAKTKSKQAGQVSMLKDDVALFSRLYIVTQHRDGDMETFFKHENHPYPPSLSERGKLRQGKKSDLIGILMKDAQREPPSYFDVRVLDGAAIVHLLPVTNIRTFNDYANEVFVPHIMKQLETCQRVDVVWDTYVTSSIKESTRQKRGKGIRRKVAGQTKVPGNWLDFLRDPDNKQELFQFLSNKIACTDCRPGKQIFITSGATVTSVGTGHCMPPCDHEEADTRIMVHLLDALESGCASCLVRTVDTDVVVILIGKYHSIIEKYPAADIWVAFGAGKNFTCLQISTICQSLGAEKSTALPLFHSFTGCDTTSAFLGKGKKSTWETWNAYPEVTEAFNYLLTHLDTTVTLNSQQFQLLEHFTVIIYDKTSTLESVNEARKELFCQKNRTMENIPPTQEALLQHTKRATYQARIWATCEQAQQRTPSPEGHGWTLDAEKKSWLPVWSNLSMAAQACNELVRCGCKSAGGCGARCTCKKAGWRCTELCSCGCDK